MIKKTVWALAASLAALGAAGFVIDWEGPLVDRLLSNALSRQTGLEIAVRGASLENWSRIRFEQASASARNKELFSAAEGELRGRGAWLAGFGSLVTGRLGTVRPAAQWAQSAAFGSIGLSEMPEIRECRFIFRKLDSDEWLLRITRMNATPVSVRGGLLLKSGRPVKAHGLLLAEAGSSAAWPDSIQKRLLSVGGMNGIRWTYLNGTFTASGARGPFFEMRWGT